MKMMEKKKKQKHQPLVLKNIIKKISIHFHFFSSFSFYFHPCPHFVLTYLLFPTSHLGRPSTSTLFFSYPFYEYELKLTLQLTELAVLAEGASIYSNGEWANEKERKIKKGKRNEKK